MTTPNYKLKNDHGATIGHVRQCYDLLDNSKLNKTGGVITGGIFLNDETVQNNELATKQYVLDNAGGGGGGFTDKIQNEDLSTKIQCSANDIQITDDSVLIGSIQKNAQTMQIKTELNGIILATDDLNIKTKDGLTDICVINTSGTQYTVPVSYSDVQYRPTQDNNLSNKAYVDEEIKTVIDEEIKNRDEAISIAKTQVSQLVDSDIADGNIYRVKIQNNAIQFYRLDNQKYLEISGGEEVAVLSASKKILRLSALDPLNNDYRSFIFAPPQDFTENAPYITNGIYRVISQKETSTGLANVTLEAYQINSSNTINGQITSLSLYPRPVGSSIINPIQLNNRLGYGLNADISSVNDYSILGRLENDGRYYRNTTKLNEIIAPNSSLNLSNQKITNLALCTAGTDAVNKNYVDQARQMYIQIQKTTNTLTNTSKVTGFSLLNSLNTDSQIVWDNTNQFWTITPPAGETVHFLVQCDVNFNITASGNFSEIWLRNFTGNTNFVGTQMRCEEQNQTGTFRRGFNMWLSLSSAMNIGFYVTAQNGSPPFTNLQITASITRAYIAVQSSGGSGSSNAIISTDSPVTQVECSIGKIRMSENSGEIFTFDAGQNITDPNIIESSRALEIRTAVESDSSNLYLKTNDPDVPTCQLFGNKANFSSNIWQDKSGGIIVYDHTSTNPKPCVLRMYDGNSANGKGAILSGGLYGYNSLDYYDNLPNNLDWYCLPKYENDLLYRGIDSTDVQIQSSNYIVATPLSEPKISFYEIVSSVAEEFCNFTKSGTSVVQQVIPINYVLKTQVQANDHASFNFTAFTTTDDSRIELRQKVNGEQSLAFHQSTLGRSAKIYTSGDDLDYNFISDKRIKMDANAQLLAPDSNTLVTQSEVQTLIGQGGARSVYRVKVLLGDVPFSTGTAGTEQSFTVNSTNFPMNDNNIITASAWVRQSGRTDTVRVRFSLDPTIVNNRQFSIIATPETRFVNASGGPTSQWQFGDSNEVYIIQSFGQDPANNRFFLHVRDINNANTQNLVVNISIIF